MRREASGFRLEQEVSGSGADPRGPAGSMERELELSLERAGIRRRRIRGGHAEYSRVDRLRTEVYRRDQWRLGWKSLRRPDGRDRLRRQASLRRRQSHGGGGWLLWRRPRRL